MAFLKFFISSVTVKKYVFSCVQLDKSSEWGRDVEQIVRKKILNRTRGRVTRPQAESERKKPVCKPSRIITINSEAQVPSNTNIKSNKTLNQNFADILYFNY